MWTDDQLWELNWWGNCINTYREETKQLLYADRMGLKTFHDGKSQYNFDQQDKRILDIGGGPVSILLKCHNFKRAKVIDPCKYPSWIIARYEIANIEYQQIKGENLDEVGWDEVWIYNVLQHTENPEIVIQNAKKAGEIIRIFEWIDTAPSKGHPHTLQKNLLDQWLNGYGKTEQLSGQNTCTGKCYYGVFKS